MSPPRADALRSHGCVACHSVDGSDSPAPSLIALAGSTRLVQESGGAPTHVVADRAYLARSIREPQAQIAATRSATTPMPTLSIPPEDVEVLIDEIESLQAG